MPSSLVRGRYVLCRAGETESTVIPDGAVYQVDGVIQAVGRYDDLLARHRGEQVLGGPEFLVMPGLVNAHHHGRGLTSFQLGSVDDALELGILRGWARRPADPYLMSLYTCMQLIRGGVTTVMHNQALGLAGSLHQEAEAVLRAFGEAGMRVAFSVYYRDKNWLVYDDDARFLDSLPSDLAADVRERLKGFAVPQETYFGVFEALHRKYDKGPEGRVRILLSPLNVQWCTDGFLARTKEYSLRLGAGIHMHLVETLYQKLYGLRQFGVTPLRHLQDMGFLGPDVSFAHAVWLTEGDIGILREAGAAVCHNPSSNLRLRSGIAPVMSLLQRGVPVAIGTDSTSLNDDDDLFQEMRLALRLHRAPGITTPCPTAHPVLKMATASGAHVACFPTVGALEPGKRADMVLADLRRPTAPYVAPDVDIVDLVLTRVRASDVHTVLIDGEVVYQDGRFPRLDQDAVVRELQKEVSREPGPDLRAREQLVQRLLPHVGEFYRKWTRPREEPYYGFNSRV
ncbi:MAG: amidohydrolase family protein [Chloroflexi bacterium]|nr:amidohydrolase family protein [Chloroflexota bacterium]